MPRAVAIAAALVLAVLIPLPAPAQYPGQVTRKSKDTPELRAVAVLEWTGEPGKPKACRIVPVTVYDGEKLQDAGIYLARPQPLALSGEVEYELMENGRTVGLFDVENAGQEQGTWVGFGKWKPMPAPKKPKVIAPEKVDDYAADDKPVLHRKNHAGGSGSTSTSDSSSSQPAGTDDPDRPKLHKPKPDATSGSGNSGDTAPDDPDRSKMHKPTETTDTPSSGKGPSSPDSKRPATQQAPPIPAADLGDVSSVARSTDPDRPKLKRGKSNGNGFQVPPTLMGLPPDMQQAVAVSDARNRPDHPWTYSWANPDDENKMKAAVEDEARKALGLSAPAPVPPPASRRTSTAAHRAAKPAAPPPPAPLEDEQFRVFELAYGSGATMVLTAHTDGPPASQKFVTIVAQPDLYGHVLVVLKSVTDMAHLDETPRMRLVDAVDALADNRGELLFELRGEGSRQFALYRIYRGTAEKLFVSGGGVYGTVSSY